MFAVAVRLQLLTIFINDESADYFFLLINLLIGLKIVNKAHCTNCLFCSKLFNLVYRFTIHLQSHKTVFLYVLFVLFLFVLWGIQCCFCFVCIISIWCKII